jgi:hypothetical protein
VLSPDTSLDAWQIQRDIYRRMSPEARLDLAVQMSEDARRLTFEGIQQRHPDYDSATARRALFRLLHGDALVLRIWPNEPLVAP